MSDSEPRPANNRTIIRKYRLGEEPPDDLSSLTTAAERFELTRVLSERLAELRGGALPERDKQLLQHFLAAIAYRTQKALRDAPTHYPDFLPGHEVRTPVEILRHMTSLMGYVRTFFIGGTYPVHPEPVPTFAEEIARFHEVLKDVGRFIAAEAPPHDITTEQLLQGPFADVMTHVGQLAILRRLAQAPVASENFIYADIKRERLGPDQPHPVRPDADWQPFKQ